jgi:hypothetical protein
MIKRYGALNCEVLYLSSEIAPMASCAVFNIYFVHQKCENELYKSELVLITLLACGHAGGDKVTEFCGPLG